MNEYVVKGDNKLTVGIGWDAKKVDLKKKIKIAIDNIMSATSEDTYDLNLAAIVEHNDGSDPELVFWVRIRTQTRSFLFNPSFLKIGFCFKFSNFYPPHVLHVSCVFLVIIIPSKINNCNRISFKKRLNIYCMVNI